MIPMNTYTDIILYILTLAVITWLFIKTRKDYTKLLKAKKDKTKDIFVSPRSFIWKGGLFIFAALYMSQTSTNRGFLPVILFAALFTLGFWNLYHALLYRIKLKY